MSMSKKDFIALADTLRFNQPVGATGGQSAFAEGYERGRLAHWNRTVEVLADFCQSQNHAFKRDRWLSYIAGECGPNGGKK